MAQQDASEEVAEIIKKVQVFIFPRRIRLKEFFVDYDPLRSGRCTAPHLGRALGAAGLRLGERQLDLLARHFAAEAGPRVQKPQTVGYARFCQVVDEVFSNGDPAPEVSPSPSSTGLMGSSFRRHAIDDEEHLVRLLRKVAVLCKTRGVVLKACFTDHDRAAVASPSRTNPKTSGKVTKSQFIRNFPFRKDFAERDLELLAECYRVGGPADTPSGNVHFMALHNDVMEAIYNEMPPHPRSDLIIKPDDTEWSHHRLHPVQKIQAKVVERRVRLYEHFQDFDPLRKGFCTVGQVKTVFTMMDIGKEIDRAEFDAVVAAYLREDGMFCYKDFCADIDCGFTLPNMEKDPLAVTTMPDASVTAPGRRNRITVAPDRAHKIADLEEKMRTRIRKRGILMKPAFQDMDPIRTGHVSREQFSRILYMMGFELDDTCIGLLCAAYCDLGNHNDVNYVDFLKSVDPPDQDQELALEQAASPRQDERCAKYFDARGFVRPMDGLAGPLLA